MAFRSIQKTVERKNVSILAGNDDTIKILSVVDDYLSNKGLKKGSVIVDYNHQKRLATIKTSHKVLASEIQAIKSDLTAVLKEKGLISINLKIL